MADITAFDCNVHQRPNGRIAMPAGEDREPAAQVNLLVRSTGKRRHARELCLRLPKGVHHLSYVDSPAVDVRGMKESHVHHQQPEVQTRVVEIIFQFVTHSDTMMRLEHYGILYGAAIFTREKEECKYDRSLRHKHCGTAYNRLLLKPVYVPESVLDPGTTFATLKHDLPALRKLLRKWVRVYGVDSSTKANAEFQRRQ